MTAFADLYQSWANLDEFEIRALIQIVLLEISEKLTKTTIWYSQDVISVYHEYWLLSLTQETNLVDIFSLVLLAIIDQQIEILINLIYLMNTLVSLRRTWSLILILFLLKMQICVFNWLVLEIGLDLRCVLVVKLWILLHFHIILICNWINLIWLFIICNSFHGLPSLFILVTTLIKICINVSKSIRHTTNLISHFKNNNN